MAAPGSFREHETLHLVEAVFKLRIFSSLDSDCALQAQTINLRWSLVREFVRALDSAFDRYYAAVKVFG